MKKYRPYFTLEELELISGELKRGGMYSMLGIIRYLDTYILGIKSGLRKENHTLKPSMEESLGIETEPSSTPDPKLLYSVWRERPGAISVSELELVQVYRYENNLMSPAEEHLYEQSLGI